MPTTQTAAVTLLTTSTTAAVTLLTTSTTAAVTLLTTTTTAAVTCLQRPRLRRLLTDQRPCPEHRTLGSINAGQRARKHTWTQETNMSDSHMVVHHFNTGHSVQE
ncbi:hypothetical protein LSAT2_016740 [Lamellibrachia satsuma]|nr:hypothetical protein LSAT2_016740 [Lamellibrachia satsuma]